MPLRPPSALARAILVVCAFSFSCGNSSATPAAGPARGANSGGVSMEGDAANFGMASDTGEVSEASFESTLGLDASTDSAAVESVGAQGDGQIGPPDGNAQAGGSDASASGNGPLFSGVANIMVLGSSNESQTCWRAFLWQKLRSDGITNFKFVGSQVVGPDCGVPGYDMACEARPGTIVTSVSASTFHGWFAANPPDIVLQHIGGADLMSNIAPSAVIMTYSVIVEQARAVNPKVIFIVAQHTPQDPAGCTDCLAQVMALNAMIPGWAAQTTTAQSPVSVVDLFTGLDIVADFSDRVHLNTAGSEIVSDRWLAALLPILGPR